MSELLALGVSHKTAPVEVRERLALPEGRAAEFMRDLRGAGDVHEAVAISTCNRTELYLVVSDPVEAESTVLAMLARQAGIRLTGLASAIYSHRNCDAARHLYRVTSGLESMIVGEAEIQGQIKRSYDAALTNETAGPADQAPVPGGAGHRQARPHRDGDRRAPAEPARGRGGAGPRAAGRPAWPRGGDRRHRRDQRADRPRAGRQRRDDRVRGHPPARPGDQPGPPLRRAQRQLRRAAAGAGARRHRRRRHRVAAPADRGARAGRGDERAGGPADADDRPRRAPGHRRVLRRDRRRLALRHRRPAGGDRPQPQGPPGRGTQGRGDHRGGDPALRRLAGLARGAPHAGGAAHPRQRDRRDGGGREPRQVGIRLPARPRAGRRPRPGGGQPRPAPPDAADEGAA